MLITDVPRSCSSQPGLPMFPICCFGQSLLSCQLFSSCAQIFPKCQAFLLGSCYMISSVGRQMSGHFFPIIFMFHIHFLISQVHINLEGFFFLRVPVGLHSLVISYFLVFSHSQYSFLSCSNKSSFNSEFLESHECSSHCLFLTIAII